MSDHFYKAEDVREAARGAWGSILLRFGAGPGHLTGGHGPCPACGGKDRFRYDDKEGKGTFLCSRGGGGILAGDGIDLVAHLKGVEWKVAVGLVGDVVCPAKARKCGSGLPPRGDGSVAPTAAPAEEPAPKVLRFDVEALRRFHRPDLAADVEWFAERSPVDPRDCGPVEFLERLFLPGEKVLIFTDQGSQGQYIHWAGHGSYVLGSKPGVKAKGSVLPRGGKEGVWFLCQPVDGRWYPNPRAPRTKSGELKLSRRSMESVTAWRYLVLESDEAPEALWRNLLAQLPLPIAAIYSSGGRSIHALVKLRVDSKGEWDAVKRQIAPLFTRLGADGGALSAVRLTRLPGCLRGERRQSLLYLNPEPELGLPICAMPVRALTREG